MVEICIDMPKNVNSPTLSQVGGAPVADFSYPLFLKRFKFQHAIAIASNYYFLLLLILRFVTFPL